MSDSKLQKDIILSGTDSLAVAKYEGVVYRLEPVEEITRIVIKDIIVDHNKVIDFSEQLDRDYEVIAYEGDRVYGNEQSSNDYNIDNIPGGFNVNARIFRNGKPVRDQALSFYGEQSNQGRFFIRQEEVWSFANRADTLTLTLYCVPVLLDKIITFVGKDVSS